jgi:hypothetical protein
MSQRCEDTFGSIESAHEFLALLTEAISETKRDVDTEIQENGFSNGSRRIDALKIALYDLEVLEHHICRSKRLLNDLCMVRRLLLADRGVPQDQLPTAPAAIPLVRMELPVPIPHATRRARARNHVQEELAKVAC